MHVDSLCLVRHGAGDEAMQGIRDALDTDGTAALDSPGHPRLVALVGTALALRLAADQGLVHLDDADQPGAGQGIVIRGFTDPVTEVPGRLIRRENRSDSR